MIGAATDQPGVPHAHSAGRFLPITVNESAGAFAAPRSTVIESNAFPAQTYGNYTGQRFRSMSTAATVAVALDGGSARHVVDFSEHLVFGSIDTVDYTLEAATGFPQAALRPREPAAPLRVTLETSEPVAGTLTVTAKQGGEVHRPDRWSAGAIKSDDPTTISVPPDRSAGGPAGIWVQHGSTQDLLKQSFVKGGDVTIAWKDVEVAKDVWNFTSMDQEFAAQAASGFYIETSLQAGPMAPTWLYDAVDKGGAGLTPTLVVMANHTGALRSNRLRVALPSTWCVVARRHPRPVHPERHLPIPPLHLPVLSRSALPVVLPACGRSLRAAYREPAAERAQQDHREPSHVRYDGG